MEGSFALLLVVIALAVVFDFINGFHDTANAIATVVATRVLTPLQAIAMAGILNFLGAVSGTAVAKTVGAGLVDTNLVTQTAVAAALIGAIVWNLITWYYGIPSSSSHALIGGVIGAVIAQAGFAAPKWAAIGEKVVGPLVASPVIGFLLAGSLMLLLMRLFFRSTPAIVSSLFGRLQLVSSAFMAFSHGSNDAQKTMGIITLSLVSYYNLTTFDVPLWVILLAATAMGFGTAAGGWRIIRTMGTRLAQLRPIHGFAAETAAGIVIETASRFGFPLSTTHVISSSILGASAAWRSSRVRWGIAGGIVTAWILTIPICALIGFLSFVLLHAVVG
ncbi:MAG TPA: inorganic phosphate transporter [Chloroflexota bacterium]|nr:inorganic phosphate transporter [Chloroflexota bacterium]